MQNKVYFVVIVESVVMETNFVEGVVTLKVSREHNERCRRAGMGWDKTNQQWVTPFTSVLRKLISPENTALRQLESFGVKSLEASTLSDITCRSFAVPEGLAYKPFQIVAINYLLSRPCTLLAEEMGLGKTVEAIGALNQIPPAAGGVLVICPANAKINWKRELDRWLVQPMRINIVYGSDTGPPADVYVINYDIVHRHDALLKDRVWDVVILDEAQYLKNPKSRRTRTVLGGRTINKQGQITKASLPIRGQYKWALTGTPVENRIIEIFPLFRYLSPYAFPNKHLFEKRYCDLKQIDGFWDNKGASNVEELQVKLRSTFMIRRKKEDVLKDLPAKTRQVIALAPDKTTGNLVQKFSALANDSKKAFRQLCYDEGFGDAAMATVRRELGLKKVGAICTHLEQCLEQVGKTLCFVIHKDVVSAIREKFKNVAVCYVGGMTNTKRQESIDRFQNDPSAKLFIGNIDAAGVAITLTAARVVVFGEMSLNPAKNAQAEDRAHRIGLHWPLLVQYLVWDGSVEAYFANQAADKIENVEALLDNLYLL